MSLLEQFNLLRNNDSKKRQEATIRIFAILDIASKPTTPVSSLDDLKSFYGPDVEYTYSRLAKGLASNRESARLGFSAALSELLRALREIDIAFVVQSIVTATTTVGNNKGQEIRDAQFGRLFGIQAIVTSGILTRANVGMEDVTPILVLLYELAMSKGWLRESCANVIISILHLFVQQDSPLTKECAQTIHEMLKTSQLTKTLEGVVIELSCLKYADIKVDSTWHKGDILHARNLPALNRLLRDQNTTDQDGAAEKQSGAWKPKLHFAWLIIIRAILSSPSENRISIKDFWRTVVDEGLFSANASHERKYWGFQLFDTLIETLPSSEIKHLFTPKFLSTLSNQVAQTDRYLHKAAQNSIAVMLHAAKLDQEKVTIMLKALWKHNFFFDQRTKQKPCEKLISMAISNNDNEIFTVMKHQCNMPQTDTPLSRLESQSSAKEAERRRQRFADHCILLVDQADRTSPLLKDIYRFFVAGGYFHIDKPKKMPFVFDPELSDATRALFRSRLLPLLGHHMYLQTPKEKAILQVVRDFKKYRGKKHFKMVLPLDENILALLERAETIAEEIKLEIDPTQQLSAIQLLLCVAIVEVYTGDADAAQVLENVMDFHNRYRSASNDKTEQDHIADLMNLLLDLLSYESVAHRKLVNAVFTVFAPELTSEAMQLFLGILDGTGLYGMTKGEAADESEADNDDNDDEDDDDDEDDTDEDMIDGIDEADTADEAPGDDEAYTNRNVLLQAAVDGALGSRKRKASALDEERPAGEGHKSDEEADSDEEEDLMDDDEMFARDETLASVFTLMKEEKSNNKKQDRTKLRMATITLKRRTLDLLQTYVKICPTSDHILDIILPTLSSARKSRDAEYTKKVLDMLQKKVFKYRVLPIATRSRDAVLKLINEVHVEARRSSTLPQLAAASRASLFLAKVLLQTGGREQNIADVEQIYADTLNRRFRIRNKNLSRFFFDNFNNWSKQMK